MTGGGGVSDHEDNTAQLWDVESGEELTQFLGTSERITCVAFSPDGKNVLIGNGDLSDTSDIDRNVVQMWTTEDAKELRSFRGHLTSINAVAVSSDGNYLLTGSDDHTARLWDFK